jgi:YidC/Oxa1 family membrane protein insertase
LKRRILLLIGLICLVTLISGCSQYNQPINAESTGYWNQYIVYPFSQFIIYVAKILGNSYGWSIILVTILIRLIILPLMVKQTRSSKAMQILQPELKSLKKKYSSKDQKTQQQLQKETMGLFQKHGVNPLAGCLPMVVQMPILLGFYHAIRRTEEIATQSFLWFNLGDKDPYFILPILAGITTFIQQKVMMAGAGSQNPQMAMMLYLMPIMIVIFAVSFPSALSLYWVVGNIFMIVQTYFIKAPVVEKSKTVRGAKK